MRILTAESKSLHLSDLYSTYPLIALTKEDFPTPDSPISAILNSSTPRRSSSSPFGIKPKAWTKRLNMTKTEIYDCLKEIKEMKSRMRFTSQDPLPPFCAACVQLPPPDQVPDFLLRVGGDRTKASHVCWRTTRFVPCNLKGFSATGGPCNAWQSSVIYFCC